MVIDPKTLLGEYKEGEDYSKAVIINSEILLVNIKKGFNPLHAVIATGACMEKGMRADHVGFYTCNGEGPGFPWPEKVIDE